MNIHKYPVLYIYINIDLHHMFTFRSSIQTSKCILDHLKSPPSYTLAGQHEVPPTQRTYWEVIPPWQHGCIETPKLLDATKNTWIQEVFRYQSVHGHYQIETLPTFTQFLHDTTLLHLCFVVVGLLPTFGCYAPSHSGFVKVKCPLKHMFLNL